MTLLQKVQNKIRVKPEEYTQEFYENSILELGFIIIEFVKLNSSDKELITEYYKKVLINIIRLSNKDLVNINPNAKLNIELLVYEKDCQILIHPKFIFYNFLGLVINCHLSKYDVITWIKVGEKLGINIKEIFLSILKEE